jgi:hypothetical protein
MVDVTMSESEIKKLIRGLITHGNVTIIKEQYVLIHEWLTYAKYKDSMSTTTDAYNICKKKDCKVPGCHHKGRHLKARDCAVECPVHAVDEEADGGCEDYEGDENADPYNNSR